MKNIKLNNGVLIPQIGLGTWLTDNDHIYETFNDAVSVGYRHIDSAQGYGNEENLGRALNDTEIKRGELFITTKVADIYKTYEDAKASIEESLRKLNTPYIDLVLIHTPTPWQYYPSTDPKWDKANIEVWRAMTEFYKQGKIRAIGVSNFSAHDIQNLLDNCEVKPVINQIPVFIGNTNLPLIDYCKEHDIAVEAYSPIAHGKILDNEKVREIADRYHRSIAELCLAYDMQLGLIVLPKTLNREHMKVNLNVDFRIDDDDFEYLKSLKLDIRW